MGTTALVNEYVKLGQDVIGLTSAAGIPIDDAFWVFQPQTEEWRLVLSSPWVDQKGVRDAYLAISNVLNKSPIVEKLPIRLISVRSPKDPYLDDIRRSRNPLGSEGSYWATYLTASDSYHYKGALHIVLSQRSGQPVFHVTFAPYKGAGGAVPALELRTGQDLTDFLTNQVGIDPENVRFSIRQLHSRGSYSFPEVHFQTSELRKFGLLPSKG
ncbi:MAG TPA: hypothetical protein VI488_12295 [Candidatus Angelobacter sp.]